VTWDMAGALFGYTKFAVVRLVFEGIIGFSTRNGDNRSRECGRANVFATIDCTTTCSYVAMISTYRVLKQREKR
jgi:hypothetical protein